MAKAKEKVIDSFTDDYNFLSNFYPCRIEAYGYCFNSVEAAFQAAKCLSRAEEFTTLSAASAKRLGKKVELRPDWEKVKLDIMSDLLYKKFKNPELRGKLLATKDAILIEGNHWHDTYWGVCRGKGANHLGKQLMEIRELARIENEIEANIYEEYIKNFD